MRRKEIDIARLAALSDGVFAVAMTLLVVALPLPRNAADLQGRPLSEHLLTLLPQFRAVVISFVVAAAFWRAHHDFFRALVRADRTVAWLNFLLLFAVVLAPLGTHLLGNFPTQSLTVDLYALDLALIGIALLLLWWHAGRHPELLDPAIDRSRIRRTLWAAAWLPLVLLASIPVSWVAPDIAVWTWLLLVPVSLIRPRGEAARR
jgi:TMEM175 potassium channel family protein